jgi:hypothetical protein
MRGKTLKIIISTSNIAEIENCSARTASQKMNDIKAFFKKPEKRHKVTFKEYAQYIAIPCDELEAYR